jgi:hypothetical protein
MRRKLFEKRFRKGWVAVVLLGIVALYPLSNNFRRMVNRHGAGLSSATALASTGLKALAETRMSQSTASGWVQDGWSMTVRRLDLLPNVGLVLWLGPRTSALQGKERWWMVPYYPFIPRFVWRSKPILDIGSRFSVATGSISKSSMAITYPGDLYATWGMPGIVLGMFLLGIVSQLLANTVTGSLDKRHLFVYAAMFLGVADMEIDYFSFWTSLIKSLAILTAIALVIYGPRRRAAKASATQRRCAPSPCEF